MDSQKYPYLDNKGMAEPYHDQQIIDESAAPTTTTITYKLAGKTVAVKTIGVSGTTTTITMVAY
jgi:hypothetical protein